MPLYEYQCDDCQRRFEVIQKFSDPPVESCPTCTGLVKRLISSPAIHFRGSGFYLTDYGRGGQSKHDSDTDTSASRKENGAGDAAKAGSPKGETAPDGKTSDSKGSETKTSDSKSSEGKTSGSKRPETKSPETKSTTSSETKAS